LLTGQYNLGGILAEPEQSGFRKRFFYYARLSSSLLAFEPDVRSIWIQPAGGMSDQSRL
jgi:hypothetical protein